MNNDRKNVIVAAVCGALFVAANVALFLTGRFPLREAGIPDWTATAGVIAAALVTLSVYSYLYCDNPFFRATENLLVGLGLGISLQWTWFSFLKPDLYDRFVAPAFDPAVEVYRPDLVLLIPAALGALVLLRISPKAGWVSRYPIAFMVGYGTGFGIQPSFHSFFLKQVEKTMMPVQMHWIAWTACLAAGVLAIVGAYYASKGGALARAIKVAALALALAYIIARNTPALTSDRVVEAAFRGVDTLLIVLGVATVLCYFFFSAEHKGALGAASKVGIVFLMVAFGASFGYTVMARESLVIGRIQFLLGDWLGVL
jgi:hypothetical protein